MGATAHEVSRVRETQNHRDRRAVTLASTQDAGAVWHPTPLALPLDLARSSTARDANRMRPRPPSWPWLERWAFTWTLSMENSGGTRRLYVRRNVLAFGRRNPGHRMLNGYGGFARGHICGFHWDEARLPATRHHWLHTGGEGAAATQVPSGRIRSILTG